ncbi:MAG TPA: tetratricopeptide repeat protein [Pyrinomonadaceae bacterium]|nr:tetratricopeptide repeat protein [Pyrinomonadaceae bacterium]
MGGLWPGVGKRPTLEGLKDSTAAEVLLRVGVLTGFIGSAGQVEGAQASARNLIGESVSAFEALLETDKVAEALAELALCYWREGLYDEARAALQESLRRLAGNDCEVKAVALLRSALIEKCAKRYNEALRLYVEAAPLFEEVGSDAVRGRFHNSFANLLALLADSEGCADYRDRAFVEYAAASYYFEQAGHGRFQACVENNLGFLFGTIGKYDEAHEHLDRAQALFNSLNDSVRLAQLDETRARLFLAEGRAAEAERLAGASARALENGGEKPLLVEALTTHGVALARLGSKEEARRALERALEVAELTGDSEGAGQAALTLIEEVGGRLTPRELSATFERAMRLLAASRHPGSKVRLLACSRKVLSGLGAQPRAPRWEGFSLDDAVHRFEARLVENAMRDAGGVVTRAARMLGVKRQSLSTMLHSRHSSLLPLRAAQPPARDVKQN